MVTRGQTGRVLLAAATVVVGALSARGAEAVSPDELLRRAQGSRRAAEKLLADARVAQLAERKALAEAIQQAYADLDAARAEADQARTERDRLQADAEAFERTATLVVHRTRSLLAQLAAASETTIDPNADVEPLEQAVWQTLAGRLAGIEAGTRVDVRRATVVGRDGRPVEVPVLRLGAYAAYACGESRPTCGLLRALPDGREGVVGPYLGEDLVRSLRDAADGRADHVPVDVDGSLIDRAPAEAKTLQSWLAAGGLFVWPILLVGALGVLLMLDRVTYLARTKIAPGVVGDALACLARRDAAAARERLGTRRTPTTRVLLAGAGALGKTNEQREAAMESALLAEVPRLERSLSLLGALAGVAPLLGLLGTVSGMIATFDTISVAGTGNPRLVSGGISEALITTQLGLMVAIPLLLAHAWLRRWVERREAMLEYHAIQAFGIHHAPSGEHDET